jgi:NADPH:quinone reductase-like Zn-dependent oxidoreductase
MIELLESGKVVLVIDKCYPLSKTAEAFRYFEKEHARGKVIINIVPQHESRLVEKFYGGGSQ